MAASAINRNDSKSTIDAKIFSEIKPKNASYIFRKDATDDMAASECASHDHMQACYPVSVF